MLYNPGHILCTFSELSMWIQCQIRLETGFLRLFAREGLVAAGVGVGTSKFIGSSIMSQVTIVGTIIAVGFLEPKF